MLGKVIQCLSDKKLMKQHIPYRDSKLTMLLQDSLGGAAKALMIACISPSQAYTEETISTLNYATRTMNIKNKPIIQMDQKEQVRFNLKREVQLLRLENRFLRKELGKLIGGEINIKVPPTEELEKMFGVLPMRGVPGTTAGGFQNAADSKFPPIGRSGAGGVANSFDGTKPGAKLKNLANADHLQGNTAFGMMAKDYNEEVKKVDGLQGMEMELEKLRFENA